MSCLLRAAMSTAAIFTRTRHCLAKSSLYGPSHLSWKRNTKFASIISVDLEFVLTRLRAQCYATRSGSSGKSPRRSKKLDTNPVMEQEKEAFFVVRKGDVVGVYKSLSECQAQVGSSINDPPVSVYKGYSLPNDTEEYLASRGLKNVLYTIKASDLKEDLFGTLVPCLFQEPASSKGVSKDSNKRSLEVLKSDVEDAEIVSTDPSRKHSKLDCDASRKHSKLDCDAEDQAASCDSICRLREGLGTATSNVAEYRAVILGLKYALEKGYTNVHLQGDSKLIQGLWKVNNQNLSTLCSEAIKLKEKFQSV